MGYKSFHTKTIRAIQCIWNGHINWVRCLL